VPQGARVRYPAGRMNRIVTLVVALTFLALPQIAQAQAQKLLITRVFVGPNEAESISIYNPGATTIDLTHYYLSDSNVYYNVVAGMPASTTSDFVVQFPSGSMIAAGETQYVAVAGAECFRSACTTTGTFAGFGFYPSYEIASTTAANNSATVPDMVSPFAGAIGATRGLTNGGEPVSLFYWDGSAARVTDVDYVYYGTPSSSNPVVNKTGVGTYLADSADVAAHHAPVSTAANPGTCRVTPYVETGMTLTGGNGVGGSDETSETCSTSFVACTVSSVSLVDAGTSLDAGVDAGSDAGVDAGMDAGSDAGVDAGMDAAASTVDSGVDGGTDAASTLDAGTDSAVLVTTDTGATHDAGHDASAAADAAARDAASGHDAATTTTPRTSNCGCTAAGAGSAAGSWLVLLALGALIRRRVRR